MNENILYNEVSDFIKKDLLEYSLLLMKGIKTQDNSESFKDKIFNIRNNIDIKIKNRISDLSTLELEFRNIGFYEGFDLSNYSINRNGDIISKHKLVKNYNNTYFLKSKNRRAPIRFSRNKLLKFIWYE